MSVHRQILDQLILTLYMIENDYFIRKTEVRSAFRKVLLEVRYSVVCC